MVLAWICHFVLQIFHCFLDGRNPPSHLYSFSLYKCSTVFSIPYSVVALPKFHLKQAYFSLAHNFTPQSSLLPESIWGLPLGAAWCLADFSVLHQEISLPLLLQNWLHLQFLEAALCLLLSEIKGTVWSTVEHLVAAFVQLSLQGEFSYGIINCSLSGSRLDGLHWLFWSSNSSFWWTQHLWRGCIILWKTVFSIKRLAKGRDLNSTQIWVLTC